MLERRTLSTGWTGKSPPRDRPEFRTPFSNCWRTPVTGRTGCRNGLTAKTLLFPSTRPAAGRKTLNRQARRNGNVRSGIFARASINWRGNVARWTSSAQLVRPAVYRCSMLLPLTRATTSGKSSCCDSYSESGRLRRADSLGKLEDGLPGSQRWWTLVTARGLGNTLT